METKGIYVVDGSEGPSYDPYGYREVSVVKSENGVEHKFLIHLSALFSYVDLDGKHTTENDFGIDSRDSNGEKKREQSLVSLFEDTIGATLKSLIRAVFRINNPSRCPKCGSKKFKQAGGMPGETFTVCAECGEIVSCDFDERVVM